MWGTGLALLVSATYVLPGGVIYALSNQAVGLLLSHPWSGLDSTYYVQPSINIIAEIIPGYLFSGKPVVNMVWNARADYQMGK